MAEIVPISRSHFPLWRPLYGAYALTFGPEMSDPVARIVFGWLVDASHPVNGVIALSQGDPAVAVGFAHFRAFPRTLDGNEAGFLDDLFVAPEARGSSLARQLIGAVEAHGHKQGWTEVRWVTSETNYRARRLYDQVAERSDLLTYRASLQESRPTE